MAKKALSKKNNKKVQFKGRPDVRRLEMEAASSGSDGDSSDASSDSEIEEQSNIADNDMGSEEVSSDSDGGDDDSLNIIPTSSSNNKLSRRDDDSDASDDDNDLGSEAVSSSEDDMSDEDDEELPLSERLKRREELGDKTLKQVRQRKSNALKLATERLKKMKKGRNSQQDSESSDEEEHGEDDVPQRKKSKHAPAEASSKRKAYFQRGAWNLNTSGLGVDIGANRYKSNDPRMSNLTGHLNEDHFEHNYEFVNEIRAKEIQQLRKRIAAQKVTGKKGKLMRKKLNIRGSANLEEDKATLKQMLQDKAQHDRRKIDRAAKTSMKRKLRENVADGKGVYYLKKRDQKKLLLEAKFEEIRKQGGDKAVDKVLAKKRQKNKSRDATRFAK